MDILLSARKLTKHHGLFVALKNVSFDIGKGEVVAIVGPNGAGKTTLVNTLAGLYPPNSGDVLFEGRSIIPLDSAARARGGLARSFQLISVYPTFTVAEMIAVGAFTHSQQTFNMLWPTFTFARERVEVEEIASAFGLAHRMATTCAMLSQGEKKLVDVASALTLRPRLILLDEPTSGIASAEKQRIMETLLFAAKRCGVESLVLVEHDMDLIARYATRVIGLRAGQIVADLSAHSFFSDPSVIESIVGRVDHAHN